MRILYGVVGEGMGHATRSRVVLEHLLEAGHELRVVVSGRAHRFLRERLRAYPRVTIEKIQGFKLRYFKNRLMPRSSLLLNLREAPGNLLENLRVYRKLADDGFRPELVISDFESWATVYAKNHAVPVVSIDNMQIINRCAHCTKVADPVSLDRILTKLAVRIKLPRAAHYLITSFFFPGVSKSRTTLIPPILRPEIVRARREPGEHVLVYQTSPSNHELVSVLRQLPYEFRVYGMQGEGRDGNVTLCGFSEQGFVEDLSRARAVIAGGGFTVLSEAVSLRVPVLSVPIERQYEQELNARYLEQLGYGEWTRRLDRETVERFLGRLDRYSEALTGYQPHDNSMAFACVDEIVARVGRGERRIDRLACHAMGKWDPGAAQRPYRV